MGEGGGGGLWKGGCSTLHGVVMRYNVSWFLGINFMDAYNIYQNHELRHNLTSKSLCSMCVQTKVAKVRAIS